MWSPWQIMYIYLGENLHLYNVLTKLYWTVTREIPSMHRGRFPNAACDAVYKVSPVTRGPSWTPDLYPSQFPSDVRTGRAWSVCMPTHVRAGPPTVPVWVSDHRKIVATGNLHGPLLHQGSWPTWVKTSMRPKNPPQPSVRPPPPTVFHQDTPAFSPSVLMWGSDWPALPACAGTYQAAPALTETVAHNPTTPTVVGSVKINSNHAQTMDGQTAYPSPPSDPDSGVTLAASFGGSDKNSDYVESAENSPTSPANKPDLTGHIRKLE